MVRIRQFLAPIPLSKLLTSAMRVSSLILTVTNSGEQSIPVRLIEHTKAALGDGAAVVELVVEPRVIGFVQIIKFRRYIAERT